MPMTLGRKNAVTPINAVGIPAIRNQGCIPMISATGPPNANPIGAAAIAKAPISAKTRPCMPLGTHACISAITLPFG